MTSSQHLVVLVHGWLGNHKELDYLKSVLESNDSVVVHSAKCNEGRTSDGIQKGGERLAQEINVLLESDKYTSLSLVGNSLGGLYARFALKDIDHKNTRFGVFCTTVTPHLGISKHTYIPLPSILESVVARVMGTTGRDLFKRTDVIDTLNTDPTFLEPLKKFRHRIAYVNAYSTDFQVPTATAAFLGKHDAVHEALPSKHPWEALRVATRNEDHHHSKLDALGWIKVFCDVREHLVSLPSPWSKRPALDKDRYTSRELCQSFSFRSSDRLSLPYGHSMLVANAKNEYYARINSGGKPIMDALAKEIIEHLS